MPANTPTLDTSVPFRRDSTNSLQNLIVTELGAMYDSVLDIGGGTGEVAAWLAASGCNVLSIDPDPNRIDIGKKTYPLPNLKFQCAGIEDIQIEPGTYSSVLICESLHHIGNPSNALKLACDALAPNGKLLIIEPIYKGGTYEEIIAVYNDEKIAREAALAAVNQAERSLPLHRISSFELEVTYQVRGFDEFVEFEINAKRWNAFKQVMQKTIETMLSQSQTTADGGHLLLEKLHGWVFQKS